MNQVLERRGSTARHYQLRHALPLLLLLLTACGRATLPEPISQAQAVSQSPSAQLAREYAPQAFAEAEKLRAEAEYLHSQGRKGEAGAAGEQALACYDEAFALAQLSQAEERLKKAQAEQAQAKAELMRLELIQAQVEKDAQAFEMQARVTLDTEAVKDTDQISSARLEARRLAAKQLAAEAALLCLGAKLLHGEEKTLATVEQDLNALSNELSVGSTKIDLFPRATELRSNCLREITLARRPLAQKAPQASGSDELLAAISATGHYMVYRDDRGVVVNLGEPLSAENELTQVTKDALTFLGGVAKKFPHYPLVVVTHTKQRGQQAKAQIMADLAQKILTSTGAPNVNQLSVDNAQPVVFPSIKGAAEKNERIEVVFVVPGR